MKTNKTNTNNEIKRNENGVYEVQTNIAPAPAAKSIFTASNAKKFAKDSLYCAGISLASSLLLHGGAVLVNKVRCKMAEKKAANAPTQAPAPSQASSAKQSPEDILEAVEAEVLEEEILEEELLDEGLTR